MFRALEVASHLLLSGDEDLRIEKLNALKGKIPPRSTLQFWKQKLDWCSILYDRAVASEEALLIGTWGTDGSEKYGRNYLITRTDDVILPQSISAEEELKLDYTPLVRRRYEVPATLGYGEADLPHKYHAMHHQFLMRTGGGTRLEAFRWSRISCITDQGTEKGLEHLPWYDDAATAQKAISSGEGPPPDSTPEKYYFPRMLGYSGPLHVVWNAFRTQIESCPLWEWWRSVFAAILAVVGIPMVRRRFIALSSLTPSEVKIFSSFGSKVVDWKWEYMETSFDRLTDGVEIFFQKLDVPRLQKAAGAQEGGHVTIDGKCWALLQATQALGWDKFAALLEFFAVFSNAVGTDGRWFKGCPCHDFVWTDASLSAEQKAQKMLNLTGGVSTTCWRRGRRASELARGKARVLAESVRHANSARLSERLSRLCLEDRKELLMVTRAMRRGWCEEFLGKKKTHTTNKYPILLQAYGHSMPKALILQSVAGSNGSRLKRHHTTV